MAIFGNTSTGGTSISIVDNIVGSTFTCPHTGIGNSISFQLTSTLVASNVKCAIYDVAKFIASTEQISYTSGGTKTLHFTGDKPFFIAGKSYTLVAWASGGVKSIVCKVDASGSYASDAETYGVWPDPAGFSGTGGNTANIYCTYDIVDSLALRLGMDRLSRMPQVMMIKTEIR